MSINLDAALAYVAANKGESISATDPMLGPLIGSKGTAADVDASTATMTPIPQIGNGTMTGKEWASLIQFYINTYRVNFPYRAWQVFERKFAMAAAAVLAAKQTIKGTVAHNALDGDLILSQIRPETISLNTSATFGAGGQVFNWISTATAGWGSTFFFDMNLNSATGGSVTKTPQNRVAMVILGLADLASSPKVLGYQWKFNGTQPIGVRYANLIGMFNNVNLIDLENVISVEQNRRWTLDVNFAAAGQTLLMPVGIQMSSGDYATTESG